MRNLLFILIFLFLSIPIFAQTNFFKTNTEQYYLMDRSDVLNQTETTLNTSFKPLKHTAITDLLDSNYKYVTEDRGKQNFHYLYDEIQEYTGRSNFHSHDPVFKYFFVHGNKFYHKKIEQNNENIFQLTVNPILNLSTGFTKTDTVTERKNIYLNSRGIEIYGLLGKNLSYYSYFADNQTKVPGYAEKKFNKEGAVTGEGQWVAFKNNGYDFYSARAYLSFNANRFININFGNGRHFIGNGYRSLILSDNANDYVYLKLQTNVWKIQYTNLFAEMIDFIKYKSDGAGVYPKKYFALHHLSFQFNKHLNIGVFETVINGLPDSLGGGIELSYLNPLIFYRSAERNLGSPHNSNMGIDIKINLLNHLQVYSQILLDDYNFGERKNGKGWWGNKYGIQGGVKYYNAFSMNNLDLQYELNFVKPYTYTHWYKGQNYSHFGQALAHPLGANFIENIYIVNYQLFTDCFIKVKYFSIVQGTDSAKTEWGSDIFGSGNPQQLYDNKILQGLKTDITMTDIMISYRLRYNIFLDGIYFRRKQNDAGKLFIEEGLMLGFRMNIGRKEYSF